MLWCGVEWCEFWCSVVKCVMSMLHGVLCSGSSFGVVLYDVWCAWYAVVWCAVEWCEVWCSVARSVVCT